MLLKRIIPCLDVDKGRVVKGVRYVDHVDAGDPVEVAQRYDDQEADEITFLDITASHEGRGILLDVVARTAETVFMPLTVGGGVRSLQDVRDLLNAGADKVSIMTAAVEEALAIGVDRVVLGTAALRDPELVRGSARRFPGRIVVGIDAKEGRVAVAGWLEQSVTTAADLARRFEDAGVAAIVHTDIARDGTLSGPNLDASAELADCVEIPVIVSGGVRSQEDLRRAASLAGGGIAGAIVGRALYTGDVDLGRALEELGCS